MVFRGCVDITGLYTGVPCQTDGLWVGICMGESGIEEKFCV